MTYIENYPQGYYQAGDKKFISKHQALLYAGNNELDVTYKFFDHVWTNFDKSNIGKYSLQELYKQRAQQLRDKYDYLILYFSGGADSYNVLRSFVDNGIKLDEVCVKWAREPLHSNTHLYTPNQTELTAYNYLSEWDYAIKPALEWLGKEYPDIKIEIVDWFEDKTEKGLEYSLNKVNHFQDVEVGLLSVWSPSERQLFDKGIRVGSIYGVDKPNIYLENNKWYIYFSDNGVAMGNPNDFNPLGTEYFYHSPDFPLLAFEMAKRVIDEFKVNNELMKTVVNQDNRRDRKFILYSWQIQQKQIRHIIYDNWTDRFQAYKPMKPDRSDKHWWIYSHPELKDYLTKYTSMFQLHIDQIKSRKYLAWDFEKNKAYHYQIFITKKYFVCD